MSWLTFFYEEPVNIHLGSWITLGDLQVNYGFLLDSLSMVVIVPVGIVTLCVLFYALDYMKHDPNRNRFYITLSIFGVFMSGFVISNNYIFMFLCWEMLGVISYLLISFWSTRIMAMKSALSAILLNRVGDMAFVIAIGIMISLFHTVDFLTLELIVPHIDTNILNILAILLLIACTAKSAQLGLHSWLLAAMEGPTPVSALLHAATMVCAGIYLLVRSSFILEYTPSILLTILWLAGLTTLVSGLIAVVTNDIKRVIALSTMSQLAMMMLAIGSSAYDLAIYHLYCHAFFKALLFMSAGSIIHSYMSETQDMRKYGGLLNYLPFSYTSMLIASLSLMAIPGLTGYYSKDIIIESLYGTYTVSGYIMYYIAVASATLTCIYSLRVLYLTFYNIPRSNKYMYSFIHESNHMAIPMTILAIYSIFVGYARDNVTFHLTMGLPNTNSLIETEYTLPAIFKLLPLILGLGLSLSLVYIYEFAYNMNKSKFAVSIYTYFNQRIFFDQILNNLIIRPVLRFGGSLNSYSDQGLFKVLGNVGISRALSYLPILLIINILWIMLI